MYIVVFSKVKSDVHNVSGEFIVSGLGIAHFIKPYRDPVHL